MRTSGAGYRIQDGTATGRISLLRSWSYYETRPEDAMGSLSERQDLGPAGQALLLHLAENLAMKARPEDVNDMLRRAGEGWLRHAVEGMLVECGSREINEKLTGRALLTSTLISIYRTSGLRDRKIVRLLLEREDLPQHLERELAEEAVIRGVKLRTQQCDAERCDRAYARISTQLAPELERLSNDLGVRITAQSIVDPQVRVLAARLVRHARNLAGMPAGSESRRRRAEILFARSWQKACQKIDPELHRKRQAEETQRIERNRKEDEWRKRSSTHRWEYEVYDQDEEGEHVGSADAGRRVSGRCCTACQERSIPAPEVQDPASWVEELIQYARTRRPGRAWSDVQGRIAWGGGPLLLELLRRHEEIPDQVLAGIKRASAWHDGHMNPNVPVRPENLLTLMGPQGVAALLMRLRTIRTQWPENHRPPRYIRNQRSGVEWRSAGRFLVKNGSEVGWLLDTAKGEDMLPDAARCALLLGPEVLAERNAPELHEMLAAAAEWDISTFEGVLAATRNARGAYPLEHAAVLLASDLNEEEKKIAIRLSENWTGTTGKLIEVAKVL